ncbi:hypothetical protein [Streptomyces sp. NPDC058657]|uniref:DUF7224 domain-containing protein n=1 Tax=unclassified Streptomyces TaxID=2593676 RepID=UPI0036521202
MVQGRVAGWAPARSGFSVLLPLLLPVLAMGVFGMAVATYITVSAGQPSAAVPSPEILGMWLFVLTAHSMAGFLIGKYLPRVLAAPLALIASFLLTAYPAAFEPLWLRHLVTGGISTCCSLDQTLDWRGPASAASVALGVLAAVVLILAALPRVTRMLTAVVSMALGLTAGVLLAGGLSADPVKARSKSELQCESGNPRICIWPELSGDSEVIRENAADARARLMRVGLAMPDTLTMDNKPGQGELFLGSWSKPTPTAIRSGVAHGLIPDGPPECWLAGSPFPGGAAFGPLASWATLTAGGDGAEMAVRYGQKDHALAVEVTKWPAPRQKEWFDHNRKSLDDCTTKPAVTRAQFDAVAAVKKAGR